MSGIKHRLVGYDRATERVADEYDLPEALLSAAKALARVPADDPEAAMCYPLAPPAARDLAGAVNARIDPERRDYYLEGFAAD